MKALIGICTQWGDDGISIELEGHYLALAAQSDLTPVVLPPASDPEAIDAMLSCCDGILIPGGNDIDPALYGQKQTAFHDSPVHERDIAEPLIIRRALELNMPYLGICRGIQILNVALGGTLRQELSGTSEIEHAQSANEQQATHVVDVTPDSLLSGITDCEQLKVNSLHHQAIDRLASGLSIDAVAPDGVIEAVSLPDSRFCLAVQWHPEQMLQHEETKRIGKAFAAACEQFRSERMAQQKR